MKYEQRLKAVTSVKQAASAPQSRRKPQSRRSHPITARDAVAYQAVLEILG